MPRQIADFTVYIFVRSVIAIVQAIPLSTCEAGAELLATFFSRVLQLRRQVIEGNLQQAFPQLTHRQRQFIAWQMWRHLFLMAAEIAHTPRKIHRTNWKEHSNILQVENFVL